MLKERGIRPRAGTGGIQAQGQNASGRVLGRQEQGQVCQGRCDSLPGWSLAWQEQDRNDPDAGAGTCAGAGEGRA